MEKRVRDLVKDEGTCFSTVKVKQSVLESQWPLVHETNPSGGENIGKRSDIRFFVNR